MSRFNGSCGLKLALLLITATGLAGAQANDFVGNEACTECHQQAARDWQGSHHDLAMQEANADTVLGDFNDVRFTSGNVTTRFLTRDGQYFVETDNAQGELEQFPVPFVFGVYPLQQLLLPLPGGRLQAHTIAWDARPSSEGGQRWYSLHGEEVISADDPLHWTGPYQNWNTRCAECHSTDVVKGYEPAGRQFDTQYQQIDVGCEACHGPGRNHVQAARQGGLEALKNNGLVTQLRARGHWQFSEGQPIAARSSALENSQQIDNCGRCHARRSTLGDYHYGRELLDTHRLATIESPLYWDDGQIRDEVYVYGSFIQSKMYQAGVVCSNCHNPHSNALLAEGNALCGQCHQASTYNTTRHHHHPTQSTGAACVNCHMPSQVYMGVDARRDHSMRIPRPDLSLVLGSPNACNQCHADQTPSWALQKLTEWGQRPTDTARHPARALQQARQGDLRAIPQLSQIVTDDSLTAMLRASATSHLGDLAPPNLAQTLAPLLSAEESLLRSSAVRASATLPPTQRYLLLRPLIGDAALAVRMAVAEQLADLPSEQLRPKDLEKLGPLFNEYLKVQSQHLDMPSVQVQLAQFYRQRGDLAQSEIALREALRINAQLEPARINLADLLRTQGNDDIAVELLSAGLAHNPQSPALHHSLGLCYIRTGERQRGLEHLKQAADNELEGSQYRYVYAIALHDTGDPKAALALLERLNLERPGQPNVLYALVGYSQELGNQVSAQRYQQQLQILLGG